MEHYDLSQNIFPAELLIVKNYLPSNKELFSELSVLDWDKKAKMYTFGSLESKVRATEFLDSVAYGRVVNKKVRYNLIFADFDQEPEYEKGKERIYNCKQLQLFTELRANLERDLRIVTKQKIPIVGEGNYYYELSCYIGYHGDTERKLVMGVRLGNEMRLLYQWYKQKETYGEEMEFLLAPGDLYTFNLTRG